MSAPAGAGGLLTGAMANMAPEQYKGQSGSFDRLKEVAVEYGFFCMAGNRQQSNKAERE
ncbi:MAG TPA: hypothetical protein VF691_02970 [Cytophagaceae bacterium]